MNCWTYSRGVWTKHPDYPVDARSALAKDRVRKWGLQQRWLKFPQLGPVPEKWMDVGTPWSGVPYINEVMIAEYAPAVRHMLNEPSPLAMFLSRRAA